MLRNSSFGAHMRNAISSHAIIIIITVTFYFMITTHVFILDGCTLVYDEKWIEEYMKWLDKKKNWIDESCLYGETSIDTSLKQWIVKPRIDFFGLDWKIFNFKSGNYNTEGSKEKSKDKQCSRWYKKKNVSKSKCL